MTNLLIGAGDGSAIKPGDDVIVLPGEMTPLDTGATMHIVKDLPEAVWAVRSRFGSHAQIATLGSTRIVCDHRLAYPGLEALRQEWMPTIDKNLEMILDDLGNCAIDSWDGARHAIQQGAHLETCPNTDSLHNALAGKPAICLGAGPTAQKYLDRINTETHYVFCPDALSNGVPFTPHFVCMIERLGGNYDMLAESAGRGARLIAPPLIDPRATAAFNGKCLWWMGAEGLYSWLAPTHGTAYAGRSCGVLGVAAALLAGCNPIYLIGHDLAYDNGASHCAAVHPMAPPDHLGPKATDSHLYHYKRFLVEANDGSMVESSGLWSAFRQDIEHLLKFYPDRTVINCGGLSKIAGTVMGDLEISPFIVHEPQYITKPIKNWLPDVPRVIVNARKIQDRCALVLEQLTSENLQAMAGLMAVSTMVDADLAHLFNYIFSAIADNLQLRLHYRATHGYNPDHELKSALRLQAKTFSAMCEKITKDLS